MLSNLAARLILAYRLQVVSAGGETKRRWVRAGWEGAGAETPSANPGELPRNQHCLGTAPQPQPLEARLLMSDEMNDVSEENWHLPCPVRVEKISIGFIAAGDNRGTYLNQFHGIVAAIMACFVRQGFGTDQTPGI